MSPITQFPERIAIAKITKPRENAKSGLCATCLSAKTCCYTHDSAEPIIFCEEFDGFVPSVIEEREFYKAHQAPTPEPCKEVVGKGLCVNCAKRGDCVLQGDSEIAIWHCEEYE